MQLVEAIWGILAAAPLTNLLYIVAGVLVVNVVLSMLTVFLERRDAAATWAWLLVLSLIPVVGFVAYIFFGRRLSRNKTDVWLGDSLAERDLRLVNQKRMIDVHSMRFPTEVAHNHQETISLLLADDGALLSSNNSVQIFTDGREKFNALLADIEAAQHTVHLIYYIFRSDALGTEIIDALVAKAQQGVEVRVIYDALGSRTLSLRARRRMQRAGVRAYPFFGSKIPLVNFRMNYRNHRKLAVIDGEVGYIGGFNIGDEYLGKSHRFGQWRDTHVRICGEAVLLMQTQFLSDWNVACDASEKVRVDSSRKRLGTLYPRIDSSLPLQPRAGQAGGTPIQIAASGPDTEWERIKFGYMRMISAAKHSIYIQTPYFIPDGAVLESLKIAARSGIDVRIMVPDRPDHMFVYSATLSFAAELQECGARVMIYHGGFLHAKTMLVDREAASVGTANIDYRSFKLNFEVNAFMYDAAVGTELAEIFERDQLLCSDFDRESHYRVKWWGGLKESWARLIAPIL